MSVNAPALIRFEGGTSPLDARLDALGRLARDGYRVGLTVAPIQPFEGWQAGYADLFERTARALAGVSGPDLTIELITHRFTAKSKTVLQDWYPGSSLDLDEGMRSRNFFNFWSTKLFYTADRMAELRGGLTRMAAERLPAARVLYWT